MAYFSVNVEASDIIEAMLNDSEFAGEMWEEIFDGLIAGSLFDDAADFCSELRNSRQKAISEKLRLLADVVHAA